MTTSDILLSHLVLFCDILRGCLEVAELFRDLLLRHLGDQGSDGTPPPAAGHRKPSAKPGPCISQGLLPG